MKPNRLIYDVIPGESLFHHSEMMRMARLERVRFNQMTEIEEIIKKCGKINDKKTRDILLNFILNLEKQLNDSLEKLLKKLTPSQ